jgi:hypothetical protein
MVIFELSWLGKDEDSELILLRALKPHFARILACGSFATGAKILIM